MKNLENTIAFDYQDQLSEQFNYISDLISENDISKAKIALLELHYADLADFLDNTNRKVYKTLLPELSDEMHPDVLACLSDGNKQDVIEALGIKRSAELVGNLELEEAIEIIDVLDDEQKSSLLDELDENKRKNILEGYNYPENSVGRVVQRDFLALNHNITVAEAINHIKEKVKQEEFHAAIITDSRNKPVGTLALSKLIKSDQDQQLKDLMNEDFKIADAYTDLTELSFIFKQYALTIVPVTNRQGKIIGSISIDNMIYIIDEQTEAEFLHLGGVNNSDIFYNIYRTAQYRFPWLFVNLIIACLTSLVIDQFNETISKLITLATIMPIVASMGGNAGTQAMTITVRAIANREITGSNFLKVITKEIVVCALNGILLATIGAILTYFLFSSIGISLVFASAVAINFVIAGMFGSAIPIFLNHFELDPATASGVFLTAMTDAIGFLTFLGLSYFFLM